MKNKIISITLLLALCVTFVKADTQVTTIATKSIDQIIKETKHSIVAAIKALEEQAQNNNHPAQKTLQKDVAALRKIAQMKSVNDAANAAKTDLSSEMVKAITANFDKLSVVEKYRAAKTFFEAKV